MLQREWLALPGGRIRPVVSVPGCGGFAELLPRHPIAWLLDHSPDLITDDLEVKALRIGGLS